MAWIMQKGEVWGLLRWYSQSLHLQNNPKYNSLISDWKGYGKPHPL